MKSRRFVFLVSAVTVLCSCRERKTATPDPVEPAPRERLVFPDSLRVDDDTVNRFVESAMHTCVGGAYEPFRLLWSARYDPVDRAHFEKHWRSIEEIEVLALEKDPEPESNRYALCADVIFDPTQLPPNHELRDNPRRRIVLLIVREENHWRLARASKPVRQWLLHQVAARHGEPTPAESATSDAVPASAQDG